MNFVVMNFEPRKLPAEPKEPAPAIPKKPIEKQPLPEVAPLRRTG
jgi:hypothetical protein